MRLVIMAALSIGFVTAARAEGPLVHRFDQPAEEYARHFDEPARDGWQKPRQVVKLLVVKPGMTLVDLGAGTGYFMPHLTRAAGKDGKLLELDVEPQLVKYMQDRALKAGLANVAVRQVAYDDPQLDAASVDRVLIVDTWHHIDGRESYAKKLAAALRPGGRVMIVEVTKDSPHGPPREHRLSPEQVIRELESAGLTAKRVRETLPRQYIVVGAAAAK